MSTKNFSNIREEFSGHVIMIPLSCVNRLNWDKDLGQRLQSLRGNISRPKLAKTLTDGGIRCSAKLIEALEQGRTPSIDTALALAIASALGINPGQLFPLLKIEQYK